MKREERDRLQANSFGVEGEQALAKRASYSSPTAAAWPILSQVRRSIGSGLALVPDARTEPHFPPVETGRDGKYGQMTELAIPLCLGDYYGRFRVVGTTPALFDDLVYDIENNRKFEFAQGRNFRWHDAEHSYFEAVVGAAVAREIMLTELHLKLDGAIDDAMQMVRGRVDWSRLEQKGGTLIVTLGQGVMESDFALAMRRLQKDAREGRRQLSAAQEDALTTLLLPSTIVRRGTRRLTVGDQIAPKHGDPGGYTPTRENSS